MITFIFIMIGVSTAIHIFVRKPAVSLPLICLLGGLVNLADEISKTTESIRPTDMAFWGPMLVMIGAAISFPIAALAWWIFHKSKMRLTGLRKLSQ